MFEFAMGVTLKRPPAADAGRPRGIGLGSSAGGSRPGRGGGPPRKEVKHGHAGKAKRADIGAALRGGLGQFRDLNPNPPGQWPLLPRLSVWAVVTVIVIVVGWFLALSDQSDQLQFARDRSRRSDRVPEQAPLRRSTSRP